MKLGIPGKLILTIGLCALLVLGISGLMEYHAGRIMIERETQAKLTEISSRLTLTLRRSVYELDRESVRDTLLAEFPEQGLEAAAVWTRDRQRLLAGLVRGKDGQVADVETLPQEKAFIEMRVPLHLSASGTPAGQAVIGEFALLFDESYLQRQLFREISNRQIRGILIVLLVLLILGEIVRRSLVWPLEQLRQGMIKAEADEFSFREDLPESPREESPLEFREIRQMREAFSRMINTIVYRQTALKVSEERYRELVDNVEALVMTLDADLCCLFVNQKAERMFGYPLKECIGRSYLDFIVADDREFMRRTLEGWMSSPVPNMTIDCRVICPSGGVAHVSWGFNIACDYSGEPMFFRIIGRDVTVQKQAELALRDSELRFRQLSQEFEAVLEGIIDSLVLFNSTLEVVWTNRAAAAQFGLSQDQLKGRTCHQLWTGDAGDQCNECVREVFASGKAFEGLRSTVDGRIWGVKGYPVRDASGEIVNVIQISSDLTEKMNLREEATRAAHLAALGSLSAGVAHEINNPTGLILMSVPLVQAVFDDILNYLDEHGCEQDAPRFGGLPYPLVREEVPRNLLDILGGAQRIRGIVEELKNYARQEMQGTRELVDLGDVATRALRLLNNLLKNSTQFFVLEIADDLPKVAGSAQRLEQVLVNLLQNACHALTTPEQSVELKITADRTRARVIVQVRDEGVGIPAEIRDKITDPFFTTRREAGGTGLGLSVSTRIIEEHGGVLIIDSEPGHGSTFTVELPFAKEGVNGH